MTEQSHLENVRLNLHLSTLSVDMSLRLAPKASSTVRRARTIAKSIWLEEEERDDATTTSGATTSSGLDSGNGSTATTSKFLT